MTNLLDFIHEIESEKVSVFIEDCIARKDPLVKVLRLVCIQSCCNDGLKPKVLDYYKREILQVTNSGFLFRNHPIEVFCYLYFFQTYGFENILTLQNLEKTGVLRVQAAKTFASVKKSLNLIVEDVNEQVSF